MSASRRGISRGTRFLASTTSLSSRVFSITSPGRRLFEASAQSSLTVCAWGYLLIGNVKQGEVTEQAWWGRRLIRGGKWINAFMAEHPALSLVTNTNDGTYIETLLKRIA